MSSEIPSIEGPSNDSILYNRVIEILKYEQAFPEYDWRKDEEELIFLEIDGREEIIKDVFIANLTNTDELKIFVTFLKRPNLEPCDSCSLKITDPDKIQRIRDLYEPITASTSNSGEPTLEEVEEIKARLSLTLTPDQKRILE